MIVSRAKIAKLIAILAQSHNIMKKVLAKSVAVTYSLLGRKGKLKFGVLKVYSAIVGKVS